METSNRDNLYEEWQEKAQGQYLSSWYKKQVQKGRRDLAVEKIIELYNWIWGGVMALMIVLLVLGAASLWA